MSICLTMRAETCTGMQTEDYYTKTVIIPTVKAAALGK